MCKRAMITMAAIGVVVLLTIRWNAAQADPSPASKAAHPLAAWGVVGDGVADDTAALQQLISSKQGSIRLPKGVYRITSTLQCPLDELGFTSLHGDGVATIKMDGAGPALRLIGTHMKSADPGGFAPNVWNRQRMPLVDGLGILGANDEADGIEAVGTMQLTVSRVQIRGCRHGIHLVKNNRNVIVSDCHIYENRGVGVYYDDVNLHQSNIQGCHISYNDGGGIVSRAGNVRNVHITGCDLESNMGADSPATANVLIDCRGSHYGTAEVAITGCTIQHNSAGPDSANVRIIGASDPTEKLLAIREGHVTITGNVFSDVQCNVHLQECRGVTLTGNTFWMGYEHNLLIEQCSHVVIGANNLDRNPRYAYGTAATTKNRVVLRNSEDCTISGLHLSNVQGGPGMLIEKCRRMNIDHLTILDCSEGALRIDELRDSRLSGLLVHGNAKPQVVISNGKNNQIEEGIRWTSEPSRLE